VNRALAAHCTGQEIRSPSATIREVDGFLRGYHVGTKPRGPPDLRLADRNDPPMAGSELGSEAQILITGDREILDIKESRKACEL